jgi:hypothetical protein
MFCIFLFFSSLLKYNSDLLIFSLIRFLTLFSSITCVFFNFFLIFFIILLIIRFLNLLSLITKGLFVDRFNPVAIGVVSFVDSL